MNKLIDIVIKKEEKREHLRRPKVNVDLNTKLLYLYGK